MARALKIATQINTNLRTLNNCTGTACVEINKKLACTLPKSKNWVAAKCTSLAIALADTRFCTSECCTRGCDYKHKVRAVTSVPPLCLWTCALVQVIERRALAYIRFASKEFILSILVSVYVSTTIPTHQLILVTLCDGISGLRDDGCQLSTW